MSSSGFHLLIQKYQSKWVFHFCCNTRNSFCFLTYKRCLWQALTVSLAVSTLKGFNLISAKVLLKLNYFHAGIIKHFIELGCLLFVNWVISKLNLAYRANVGICEWYFLCEGLTLCLCNPDMKSLAEHKQWEMLFMHKYVMDWFLSVHTGDILLCCTLKGLGPFIIH